MNPSEAQLLAIALGTVIPALTALATKWKASQRVKTLVAGMLAAVAGGLSGAYAIPPHGIGQWVPILENIGFAWITAAATYVGAWQPTGASAAIARATARFGVGTAHPQPQGGVG